MRSARVEFYPYFVGLVRLIPPADGGRTTPLYSGARPTWKIPSATKPIWVDALLEIPGCDHLQPGSGGVVHVTPATPELWDEVKEGSTIEMCYLKTVIGYVTVIERRFNEPGSES